MSRLSVNQRSVEVFSMGKRKTGHNITYICLKGVMKSISFHYKLGQKIEIVVFKLSQKIESVVFKLSQKIERVVFKFAQNNCKLFVFTFLTIYCFLLVLCIERNINTGVSDPK